MCVTFDFCSSPSPNSFISSSSDLTSKCRKSLFNLVMISNVVTTNEIGWAYRLRMCVVLKKLTQLMTYEAAILVHTKNVMRMFLYLCSLFTAQHTPVIRKTFWDQRQSTNPIQLIFPLHVHNLSISIQFLIVPFNPNRIQSQSMRKLRTEKNWAYCIVMCVKWILWPLHFSFFFLFYVFVLFFFLLLCSSFCSLKLNRPCTL